MKNIIKTAGYSLVAVSSVAYTSVNAAIDYQSTEGKVDSKLKGNGEAGIGEIIQTMIIFLLGFLALIATVLVIWAGFNIMTAGGDEEKVKKGKTTMINALIGLFVIFMAWQIVGWIFGAVSTVTVA